MRANRECQGPFGLIFDTAEYAVGLSAYPSAVDQGVNPAAYSKPDPTASSAKGVGGGSMTPFSSYIVLNGNQKRYPGYLATQADASTIPYLSAKLQQQAPNHGQIR